MREIYNNAFIKLVSNEKIDTDDNYDNPKVLSEMCKGVDIRCVYKSELADSIDYINIQLRLNHLMTLPIRKKISEMIWSYILYLRANIASASDSKQIAIQKLQTLLVEINSEHLDNVNDMIDDILSYAKQHRGHEDPDLYEFLNRVSTCGM